MKSEISTTPCSDKKRKLRNDLIFISAILLLILLTCLVLFIFRTDGDTVTVTVDGSLFGEYSLGKDQEIEINTDLGYNLLVIKDGKAYVEYADCPDGICSSHRPVEYDGESIICLPNKVVIEIKKQGEKQPDIIIA